MTAAPTNVEVAGTSAKNKAPSVNPEMPIEEVENDVGVWSGMVCIEDEDGREAERASSDLLLSWPWWPNVPRDFKILNKLRMLFAIVLK